MKPTASLILPSSHLVEIPPTPRHLPWSHLFSWRHFLSSSAEEVLENKFITITHSGGCSVKSESQPRSVLPWWQSGKLERTSWTWVCLGITEGIQDKELPFPRIWIHAPLESMRSQKHQIKLGLPCLEWDSRPKWHSECVHFEEYSQRLQKNSRNIS